MQANIGQELVDALHDLQPLLDEKFADRILRIERLDLELELPLSSLGELRVPLRTLLIQQLEKLEKDPVDRKPLLKSGRGSSMDGTGDEAPEGLNTALPTPIPHQWTDRIQSRQECLLHFLRSGTLPWHAEEATVPGTLYPEAPEWEAELIRLLGSDPQALRRFLYQLDERALARLATAMAGERLGSWIVASGAKIRAIAEVLAERFDAGYRLQVGFLECALAQVLDRGPGEFPEALPPVGLLKTVWPSFRQTTHRMLAGQWPVFEDRWATASGIDRSVLADSKGSGTQPPDAGKGPAMAPIPQPFSAGQEPGETKRPNQTGSQAIRNDAPESSWQVQQAGIILLHPFLPAFFKKVGLVEGGQFLHPDSRQRAVCLLHFLATGELIFPEPQLLLAKFLCRYPLEAPIPRALPISTFEQDEAIQLLQAALGHWKALKNTSPDGLRVNFFQRSGLLIRENGLYTLHVEQHAADILLDQLPWPLSMVRLPWMKDLLTVKWR